MTERAAATRTGARDAEHGAAAEFERLYRANVEAVTAYFARRSADSHVVADLTADTFVTAITSFGSFDPGRGTARAWVFGTARHVYAAYYRTPHPVCPCPPSSPLMTRHRHMPEGRRHMPGRHRYMAEGH